MAEELDPMRGSVRWGIHRSKDHRAKFWVGSVIFGVLGLVLGVLVEWPRQTHRIVRPLPGAPTVSTLTTTDHLINGLVAFALAFLVVVVGSVIWSLIRAPYEQRDALRDQVGHRGGTPSPQVIEEHRHYNTYNAPVTMNNYGAGSGAAPVIPPSAGGAGGDVAILPPGNQDDGDAGP